MKKIICFFLFVTLLTGCTPTLNNPSASAGTGQTPPAAEQSPKNYNSTVGIDSLGRTIKPVSGERAGKYVGCFYWLWQGQHDVADIYDISKLLAEAPEDLWNPEGTEKSPLYAFHWWGEPLYGYYNSADEWVLRRHLEMLTYAGVDFLAIDLSNGVTYIPVIKKLMKLMEEYRLEGFDCPQITFFTHVNSKAVVEELYDKIYKKNLYPEAWWRPYEDGKPYMIAYADPDTEGIVTGSGIKRGQYSSEISDFFYFKAPQWPDEEFVADAFPWIDWGRYPQANHTNVISISPASGPGAPMSHALLYPELYLKKIWGRGWNGTYNFVDGIQKGSFFQSQWDYAIENDPEIAFIDGWNEWIAQKLVMNPETNPEVFFADAVSMEFSRDCEPMKGGYADNFLMQMAANIRAFKGIADNGSHSPATSLNWDNAAAYFDFGSDNSARSSKAAWGNTVYRQEAGRVNIQEIRVMHDQNNLYFKITAENDIGERTGENWMNLFIGTGEPGLKGWEGYEYVINRSAKGSIDKLDAGFKLESAGTCTVECDGSTILVTIDRKALGLENGFSVYFKAADSVASPEDISDYYISGQSVPMGRISFWYKAS